MIAQWVPDPARGLHFAIEALSPGFTSQIAGEFGEILRVVCDCRGPPLVLNALVASHGAQGLRR